MPLLVTAVVAVGLLGALNLILTLGVVKRLREHNTLLSSGAGVAGSGGLEIGEEVGGFSVVDVAGRPVGGRDLMEDTFVAFVSPNCASCAEKLPELVAHAADTPGGRDRVLAVVVGERAEAESFVAELAPVARVVVEQPGGPLSRAFRATNYPTMLWVAADGQGRVVRVKKRSEVPA
ncbi:hypothetical protein [Micromonospora okii]|uniref:hypothetical protein n=1 Tax=Micromonospora okii TaxID=1182970 RepID=UPI001E5D24CC|nr:hypothetical protein [Micromonospora okii]